MSPVQLPTRRLSALVIAALLCGRALPAAESAPAKDIADLSLEELMRVEVTSVSKRPESRVGAASAVHVITDEDVQRQGFRTVADSLRYVPGMQVAQINSHTWAITTRGFDAEYATKLLVLVASASACCDTSRLLRIVAMIEP